MAWLIYDGFCPLRCPLMGFVKWLLFEQDEGVHVRHNVHMAQLTNAPPSNTREHKTMNTEISPFFQRGLSRDLIAKANCRLHREEAHNMHECIASLISTLRHLLGVMYYNSYMFFYHATLTMRTTTAQGQSRDLTRWRLEV